jgi:phosphatidylglycerophosphate synthase
MLANWITLSRFPILLLSILALYFGRPSTRLAGAALLFVGLMLDTVDGLVARRTRQTSLSGSVLDIAADRSYELALWVCFADMGLIPVAIPLVIIGRTTLTDALRSIGIAQGVPPFHQQRSALGRFLVGSPLMRTGYSVSKVIAFCGLALARAWADPPSASAFGVEIAPTLAALHAIAWLAALLCVLRGLPVIVGFLPTLATTGSRRCSPRWFDSRSPR